MRAWVSKFIVFWFFVLSIPLYSQNMEMRERLEEWKYSVLMSLAKESKDFKPYTKDHAYNPRQLGLVEAIEIAAKRNLGFKNTLGSLEIAARGSRALHASVFEPSLQFGWNRNASFSPAQGFIPQFNSQSDGGSLRYDQQLHDGTDLSLEYSSRNSESSFRTQQNNTGLQLSISRALTGKDNSFFGSKISLSKSERDQKIAFLRLLNSFQGLMFEVIQSFLNAYKAFEQIEVSQSVLSYRKELLDLTGIKYRLGVATRLDVLRVEVQVAREEEGEIQARNLYENRLDALLDTLNYERHEGEVKLQYDPKIHPREFVEQDLIETALRERIDLQIQSLQLEKSELDLRNAKEQVRNKVLMNASLRKHGTDETFMKANDYQDRNWSLGVSYSYPLGNNQRREVLLSEQVRVQNQQRTLQEAKNRATLEVRSSLRNILSTRKRLQVMEKNLERARENLKLAKLSYEKGIKSSIDVLDAQDDLLAVNKDYINTLIDWKIAQFELDLRTGSLPIPDQILSTAKKWLKGP
ncbi:TolC family protein [bacterium]|nr:TolC family protein [bacterium]